MSFKMPNPVFLIFIEKSITISPIIPIVHTDEFFKICTSRQEVQEWLDNNKDIPRDKITILTGNLYKVDIRI